MELFGFWNEWQTNTHVVEPVIFPLRFEVMKHSRFFPTAGRIESNNDNKLHDQLTESLSTATSWTQPKSQNFLRDISLALLTQALAPADPSFVFRAAISRFLTPLLLQAAAKRRGAQPLTNLFPRVTPPVNTTATFIRSASKPLASSTFNFRLVTSSQQCSPSGHSSSRLARI